MGRFRRGTVFVTFFFACVSAALLVASLGTRHWVEARAKRTRNPSESDGRIAFGLFEGRKELNVAYGWRVYEVDVLQLMRTEPDFLSQGLWLGTVVSICLGLLFSVTSAVFAALNTATRTSRWIASISGLYLWNFLSVLSAVAAICCWVAQFYLSIQRNVLSNEDRQNEWTSEDMAEFGYSFWFVSGAAVASLINIIILFVINTEREVETVVPVLEEKTNGAIMLY